MALTLCFAALLAAYAAFPQHALTIYPLQREDLTEGLAGAPRAGLSTTVPANVLYIFIIFANGQIALCFAALLAVYTAFPQHCLSLSRY